MRDAWATFIKRAIEGEPDDPFVTLLRRRVASGYRIVRVHFEATPKGAEYRLLLERLRELSEMRVPHSPSFTRWSLGTGTRMASVEEEEARFALLAKERFAPLTEELSPSYADAIFVERALSLAPPRTSTMLAQMRVKATSPNREQIRASRRMDVFLASLAADLGSAFRYGEAEVASILDGALERFAREHFSLDASALSAAG